MIISVMIRVALFSPDKQMTLDIYFLSCLEKKSSLVRPAIGVVDILCTHQKVATRYQRAVSNIIRAEAIMTDYWMIYL